MTTKFLMRQLDKIDERIAKIQNKINTRIITINQKIEDLNEKDRFSEIIEFIMLLLTSLKLIILGSAIFIPWSSIRDLWVKTSMGGFIIKSTKRYKKSWGKAQFSLQNQKGKEGGKEAEIELANNQQNQNDSDEDETIYESDEQDEQEEQEEQEEEEIVMNK